MDLRSLLSKLEQLSEQAAQPIWTPTPEQAKWLGGANQQDPYIISRMPGAKPPVNWFTDPADQAIAKRMGFPAAVQAPVAPAADTTPAPTVDKWRDQHLEALKNLIASAKGLATGLQEGFNINDDYTVTLLRHDGSSVTFNPENMMILNKDSMSSSLMESFGYAEYMSESDLAEYSWDQFKSDAGDTARGAWQGMTLGTGNNIAAGVKSAFGPGTYKQELAKQIAADKEAEARSPWLYGAGNIAGAVAMPVPGGAVARALGGAAKLGKVGAGAVSTAANLGTQYAIDKGVNKANTASLGYDPDSYPTTKDQVKAFQAANGLTPDGIIGPKTKAVLDKLGLTPDSVQEQIANLRQRLAMIETPVEEASGLGKAIKAGLKSFTKGTQSGYKAGMGTLKGGQAAADAMKAGGKLNKAGQAVGKTGAAIRQNPGKVAAGAAAGVGGMMALNTGGPTADTSVVQNPTPNPHAATTGTTTTPTAPVAPANSQQQIIDQIKAEMTALQGYGDNGDQEVADALQKAQQIIDMLQGNTAQAAADVANLTPATQTATPPQNTVTKW